MKETLMPYQPVDVFELDEVWSFVQHRKNKRWVWTALCRRTSQIAAFVIGDHSLKTCVKLWKMKEVQSRKSEAKEHRKRLWNFV